MKQVVFFIIAFIIALNTQAQQFIWEKSFNYKSNDDVFVAMTRINDSSVVVSGGNTILYESFFVECRASGNRPWQKFGRKLVTGEQDIQPFKKGYFYTGSLPNKNVTPNGSYVMLQRLSALGDTLWTKKYIGADYNVAMRMMVVNNNVYIGGLGKYNNLNSNVLMKTDTSGNLLWRRYYKSIIGTSAACDLVHKSNGNIIITGWSQVPNNGIKLYLVEVNPVNGDSLRSAIIPIKGGSYYEYHNWIYNNFSLTSDGNYICSGTFDSATIRLGYVAKIDTAYNVIWSRILRPRFSTQKVSTNKVKELTNGTYVILSQDLTANNYENVFCFTRFSSSGQFISQNLISSQFCNRIGIYDWELLADGSAMVAGRCVSNAEAYITRIGQVGTPAVLPASLPESVVKTEVLGQSYPNPASETAIIPFSLRIKFNQAQISIKDITGREVKNYDLKAGTNSVEINLSKFSNGLYTYTFLVDEKPIATRKLAVSR